MEREKYTEMQFIGEVHVTKTMLCGAFEAHTKLLSDFLMERQCNSNCKARFRSDDVKHKKKKKKLRRQWKRALVVLRASATEHIIPIVRALAWLWRKSRTTRKAAYRSPDR